MAEQTQFLIVDDHPLFREALNTAVQLACPGSSCFEASSIEQAISLLGSDLDIDLALLDLNMPGVQGFDGLLQIRSHHPRLPVLVVSGLESEQIIDDAIAYGAAGFLPKSLGRDVLGTAIRSVLEGGVYVPETEHANARDDADVRKSELIGKIASLTPQQLRVLFMLREGLLNKQIAYELDVGSTTVKKHVSEILRKLSVHSRTQAVIEASKLDHDELFDLEQRFVRTVENAPGNLV